MDSSAVPAEFERLIAENYERVFGVLYRLLGDREEAADLTQDTFVNAYRARAGFRGDCQASTWLYRIAVNLAKNRLEGLRRQAGHRLDPEAGAEWEERVPQEGPGPAEHMLSRELGHTVAAAVLRLRPDYREAVILREYEELSYEEIAVVCGCSVPAVKSRLFRARAMLRSWLGRYLEAE